MHLRLRDAAAGFGGSPGRSIGARSPGASGTPETPIMALPDEHIAFVMPSRFCLPDELGHEAWQRFGDLAPGWERVQGSSTSCMVTSNGWPAHRTHGQRRSTPTAPVRASAATSPT
jgi:hypothetical protein